MLTFPLVAETRCSSYIRFEHSTILALILSYIMCMIIY